MLIIFIMLYYYILGVYLSHSWKFVPFDCFHPILALPYPQSLAVTNLISFSVSLFVFEALLTYITMLVSVTQHSNLIFLYISK